MRCPACRAHDTRVLNSCDSLAHGTRRRRHCDACGHRFTTREVPIGASVPREERLRAVRALRALVDRLRETETLVAATAAQLAAQGNVDEPHHVGRPVGSVDTGASALERCEGCGGLVWRGELPEHQCGGAPEPVTVAAAELLAKRLRRMG